MKKKRAVEKKDQPPKRLTITQSFTLMNRYRGPLPAVVQALFQLWCACLDFPLFLAVDLPLGIASQGQYIDFPTTDS